MQIRKQKQLQNNLSLVIFSTTPPRSGCDLKRRGTWLVALIKTFNLAYYLNRAAYNFYWNLISRGYVLNRNHISPNHSLSSYL